MDPKPIKIVVYICNNLRMFKNGDQKKFARSKSGLKLVSIPCSGKMEAHHLLKSLAGGAAGVLVLGCAESACHYLEGSKRSHRRAGYAKEWLRKIDIEPGRVQFRNLAPMDISAFEKTLEEFTSRINSFGNIPPVANNQTV